MVVVTSIVRHDWLQKYQIDTNKETECYKCYKMLDKALSNIEKSVFTLNILENRSIYLMPYICTLYKYPYPKGIPFKNKDCLNIKVLQYFP